MATGGTLCRFFSSSRGCWYGDSCRFVHDYDGQPAESPVPTMPRCRYYRTPSGCKFGDCCRFRHDDEETRIKVEMEDLSYHMETLSIYDEKYKWESLEKEEPSLRTGHEHVEEAFHGELEEEEEHTYSTRGQATGCVYCGDICHGRDGYSHDGEEYCCAEEEAEDDDKEYYDEEEEDYHEEEDEADEEDYEEEEDVEEEDYDDDEDDNGRRLDKWMAEKQDRTKPEINESTCGECGAKFFGEDAFELLHGHYLERFLQFNPTHLTFLTTDARFNEPTICILCEKFFAKSRDLLRHTVDKTRRLDKQGEEHRLLLEKGIVEAFCYRDTVDHDDIRLTEELCLTLLNQPSFDSDDEDMFLFLRFGLNPGAGFFSGHDFDDDDDDDDDFGGGMFGFTSDECEELLCQGVKPWDSDAEDVLAALNGWD